MLKHVDFNKCKTIVELGPGNGVFTRQIIEKMTDDARLFSFETNETFYENLVQKIDDPRVHIYNESAEYIVERLNKNGLHYADCIISALPLTVIPNEAKANIMKASYALLKEGGTYVQFQYSLNARKLFKKTFKEVKIDFTPLNIPPAFLYKCTK